MLAPVRRLLLDGVQVSLQFRAAADELVLETLELAAELLGVRWHDTALF